MNLPRVRLSQRASGFLTGQTYEDRTCEIVFAGLDEATGADELHLFAAQSKIIVHEIETMLSGIKIVLQQSLGMSLRISLYLTFLIQLLHLQRV